MDSGHAFLPSDDSDLAFYFSGEAQAAMGARSAMGPQLEAVKRSQLANASGTRVWMKKPASDKRVVLSDDALMDEQIDAARRARIIAFRLARLYSEARTILELHYQYADLKFGDARVSLALCAATETALVSYHRFIDRVEKAARKRPVGAFDAAMLARGLPVRETEDTLEQSIQSWVRWLSTRKGKRVAAGSVLEAIIDEARAALQSAQGAYAQTKGRRAA